MATYISHNLKKISERIDLNGNIINPKTREIIQPAEPEFIPPPQPLQASVEAEKPKYDAMSIQDQITQAKANLKKLEALKIAKIEEMEKDLLELKK